MIASQISDVLTCLTQLKDEPDVSRSFKEKAEQVIVFLTDSFVNESPQQQISSEPTLIVEKALFMLEELNSLDLSQYYRTQVWDIICMLESTKAN